MLCTRSKQYKLTDPARFTLHDAKFSKVETKNYEDTVVAAVSFETLGRAPS